jgi:hypothetical protein
LAQEPQHSMLPIMNSNAIPYASGWYIVGPNLFPAPCACQFTAWRKRFQKSLAPAPLKRI